MLVLAAGGSMTGTISHVQLDRGVGSIRGADGRIYSFRRSDVRDCWLHDLTEGASVTFEARTGNRALEATGVRLDRPPR
jgi:cold shock CspA family protein